MGWAARAKRNETNTGVKPSKAKISGSGFAATLNKTDKFFVPTDKHRIIPNMVWDKDLKMLVSNGTYRIKRENHD